MKHLRSHLGRHLQELSLFALPSSIQEDGEDSPSSDTDSQSEGDGSQVKLESASYECVFWFLACPYQSPDRVDWRAHCRSHLRGLNPPIKVACQLCSWVTEDDDGEIAWEFQMQHLETHISVGQSLRDGQPGDGLCEYIWLMRLISTESLENLKGMVHNKCSKCFGNTNFYLASRAVQTWRHIIYLWYLLPLRTLLT